MRKPTPADAELLLHLYEMRRDPELRRARQWFLTEFRPGSWQEIRARYLSHSEEDRWFRMTTSYWEMVGTLVAHGVLHSELYFDHTGEDIVTWERCKDWIADARADIRPNYLYRFERMVEEHLAFRARAIAAYAASKSGASPKNGARRSTGSPARRPAARAARSASGASRRRARAR